MSDAAISHRAMVREVVNARRAEDGLENAWDYAARVFCLTARRIRAWWHGEIADPRLSEARAIEAGYLLWCEQEQRRLRARAELLAARQATLRAEATACGLR